MPSDRGKEDPADRRQDLLVGIRSALRAAGEYEPRGRGRDDVGVLVIRIWRETDGHLRARLTSIDAEAEDSEVISWVSSAEGLLDSVTIWLTEFHDRGQWDQ